MKDPANPTTGIIYWMLNKAWPSWQWNLFGYDFDQPGGYFGAKKANEPVHIMYSYADGSIKVANLTNASEAGLHAEVELVDLDGTVRYAKQVAVPTLSSQDVQTVLSPEVPMDMSRTYFARLTLLRGSSVVGRNDYWLSTKPDTVDWQSTHANFQGYASAAFGAGNRGPAGNAVHGLQTITSRCPGARNTGSPESGDGMAP